MSLDARVRYTKMIIRESFIQLNAKKPIEEITVKEICEMAEVNRSTFYRNFLDVYDLRDWIEDEMMERMREFLKDRRIENAEETLLVVLLAMKEHRTRYTSLHDIPSNRLVSRIIGECFEVNLPVLVEGYRNLSECELRRFYNYVCAGSVAVLVNWARNGMEEPPQEIARFVAKMIEADAAALKEYRK